jgi:aminopeptidase N
MDYALTFINEQFGQYPYPTFSFIQAGDGGMEYPMATLITGNRHSLRSLVSVSVHELLHSWYYAVLGTNENLYAWMDEGFANYTQFIVMHELERQGFLSPQFNPENIYENNYQAYLQVALSGLEEPMSVHANHFRTNTAYFHAAYAKGCVFLAQLEYMIGSQTLQRVLRRYFETWKFRHPQPVDFLRIAEKESGVELDWYYEHWILTTRQIDYSVLSVQPNRNETVITVQRAGDIPMPIELKVTARDGAEFWYYIPLDLMCGDRKEGFGQMEVLPEWPWVSPEYAVTLPLKFSQLASIVIDPRMRLADVRRADNVFSVNHDTD